MESDGYKFLNHPQVLEELSPIAVEMDVPDGEMDSICEESFEHLHVTRESYLAAAEISMLKTETNESLDQESGNCRQVCHQ